MKTIKIWMALAGMILLGSCAVTDIETAKDFSQYKTFAFGEPVVDVKDPAYKGGLIDARIKNAVREEFRKRGLEYSQENPDMIVTYSTYTKERISSNASPYMMSPYMVPYGFYPYRFGYWGYYPGMYGWGYPYGYGGRTYDYTQGTLVIDIKDSVTGEHIWRGLVQGNVTNLNGLQKQLDKAVKAIIKKYPVAPAQERLKLPANDDVS